MGQERSVGLLEQVPAAIVSAVSNAFTAPSVYTSRPIRRSLVEVSVIFGFPLRRSKLTFVQPPIV